MLRIMLPVVGLVLLSVSTASADFIEIPVVGLDSSAAIAPTANLDGEHSAGGSAQQLWRDSGHLELGYYASEGALTHKQYVRPNEAAVDPRALDQVMQLSQEDLHGRSGDGIAQLMAAVFGVLWVAGFAMRRHLLQRVRSRA